MSDASDQIRNLIFAYAEAVDRGNWETSSLSNEKAPGKKNAGIQPGATTPAGRGRLDGHTRMHTGCSARTMVSKAHQPLCFERTAGWTL